MGLLDKVESTEKDNKKAKSVAVAKPVKSTPAPKKEKVEKNPLTEGIASKAIKSTKPSKKILSEGNDLADRFKKLAGIQS